MKLDSNLHTPSVLAVIVNFRTPHMTIRAVEATLGAMEYTAGAITIVENGSGDSSARLLRDMLAARGLDASDRVRLIESPTNGGFGAGQNIGIRAGLPNGDKPDYIWAVNSDALPHPDALTHLLDAMENRPELGLAGSFVEGTDGTPHNTAFRFPTALSELEGNARLGVISRLLRKHITTLPIPEKSCDVDWTAAVSLLMRQKMLDEVGLFDEGFFLYFEETDLCHRARHAGWLTAYIRESRVRHIGSVSTGRKMWDRVPPYFLNSRWRYHALNKGRVKAALATLSAGAGAAIASASRLLRPRDPHIAPRYFRDLLAHDLRALRTGQPNSQDRTKS